MILLDITLLAAGDKVGRVIGSPIVYESYASGNANSLSRGNSLFQGNISYLLIN